MKDFKEYLNEGLNEGFKKMDMVRIISMNKAGYIFSISGGTATVKLMNSKKIKVKIKDNDLELMPED